MQIAKEFYVLAAAQMCCARLCTNPNGVRGRDMQARLPAGGVRASAGPAIEAGTLSIVIADQSAGATISRLLAGWIERALRPSACSMAAICAGLASSTSSTTCQLTFSLHGGVVSEPM